MGFDERPIDRLAKQLPDMLDILDGELGGRDIERQVLPVPNPRHQLNREQVREAKDRLRLALRLRMERVRTNLRAVFQEAVQDVDRFPDPTGNEAAEQGDVGVGDMIIADATPASVADVVFAQQILFIDIPLGAVRSGSLARAPQFGQSEAIIPTATL